MKECIFCKIIKGDIPSVKIYEDNNVIVFLDISQATRGHTLVVPKKHIKDIYELDETTAMNLFKIIPRISKALTKALHANGLNIVNNNKEVAGQTVGHFHIHLIPRYSDDDGFRTIFTNNIDKYSSEDLANISQLIKNNI